MKKISYASGLALDFVAQMMDFDFGIS